MQKQQQQHKLTFSKNPELFTKEFEEHANKDAYSITDYLEYIVKYQLMLDHFVTTLPVSYRPHFDKEKVINLKVAYLMEKRPDLFAGFISLPRQ